jgi:PilZ domain
VRTLDVSASGVCFVTPYRIQPGQWISFSLRMPGQILSTPNDVMVRCRGRVVRSSPKRDIFHTAATIDEYNFAEQ